CVFVIQARSRVCNPNSPKSIRKLREAVPLRLPRWDLRYFTLFGINGIKNFPYLKIADRRCSRFAKRSAHASHRDAATVFGCINGINRLLRVRLSRAPVAVGAEKVARGSPR